MKSRIASPAVFAVWLILLAFPRGAPAFGLLAGYVSSSGSGAGQAGLASGIDIGPDGTIYLADYGNSRVDVFAAGGTFIRAFGKEVNPSGGDVCTTATGCQQGAATAEAGALHSTTGVELGPDGFLYVVDDLNNRVAVFSPDGTFIRAFGKGVNPAGGDVCTTATGCQKGVADGSAGALSIPLGLDVDSAGTIYVVGANSRVDLFSPDGTFIRAFGKSVDPGGGNTCTAATGCQPGKELPDAGGVMEARDVAVSASGHIAVSDTGNDRISIFSPEGAFLRAFGNSVNPAGGDVCTGETGCQKGESIGAAGAFAFPMGIVVDRAGNLVIADVTNNRINEFKFDGTFIRAFGEGVIDFKPVFQVCTPVTGCVEGGLGTSPGSIPNPWSVGVDCVGAIYATTFTFGGPVPQVERFGEPDTGLPSCGPPVVPPVVDSTAEESASPPPTLRLKPAKPILTVELDGRSGTATLSAAVSELGTLWLRGKGIRTVKRVVKRIGLVELPVVPKPALKRKLQRTGKAKVKLLLTFTPDKGEPSTEVRFLVLKMALKS